MQMKKRIVVPSSVAIYEAAAELTNKKSLFAQTSSQTTPHKSLLPLLTPEGTKKQKTVVCPRLLR